MLEQLEVADGHRVLEIGTGTGYNAALLCERLGSTHVTSVDIDPELVDLAAEPLAANGYTPPSPPSTARTATRLGRRMTGSSVPARCPPYPPLGSAKQRPAR